MAKSKKQSSASECLVGILMGSKSDWEVMKATHMMLDRFGIPHECRVLSAHRTPAEAMTLRDYRASQTKKILAESLT